MELTISYTLTEWKDPMMAELYDYARHIEADPDLYGIQDMDTLFSFLQSRMEEFMKANPSYRKPVGLELCYCRPSGSLPTIRITYLHQKVTIKLKPLDHEKSPSETPNPTPLTYSDALEAHIGLLLSPGESGDDRDIRI